MNDNRYFDLISRWTLTDWGLLLLLEYTEKGGSDIGWVDSCFACSVLLFFFVNMSDDAPPSTSTSRKVVFHCAEEDLTCSICLLPFVAPLTLKCAHSFCRRCITDSLRTNESCPLCRLPQSYRGVFEFHENKFLTRMADTVNGGIIEDEEAGET